MSVGPNSVRPRASAAGPYRCGTLPVVRCAEALQQAARGLHAARKRGPVQRDLKPENIFLTDRGDGGAGDVGAGLVPALSVGHADIGQPPGLPLRPDIGYADGPARHHLRTGSRRRWHAAHGHGVGPNGVRPRTGRSACATGSTATLGCGPRNSRKGSPFPQSVGWSPWRPRPVWTALALRPPSSNSGPDFIER